MARFRIPKRLGMLLLGIWLIVTGLREAGVSFSFPYMSVVLGIFAVIAGIVIIIDR